MLVSIDEIWDKFNEIKSPLLGYIFDILVKVLRYKIEHPNLKFQTGLNRMADWEEYAEIISRCMGYPEDEFQRIYQENIGKQVDEAISANPLSVAIMELMSNVDSNETLTFTPTELFEKLNDVAENNLKMNINKIRLWPKSASYLSRRLNRVRTILREKGIDITLGDKDSKDRRQINIRKVPSVASMPLKTPNLSTNQQEIFDSTENNDKVSSKVSSINLDENQAQNTDFRQHDSIDGTLQISENGKQEKIYKCNYCTSEFLIPEEHLKHCINNHKGLPAKPSEELIETMRQNGENVEAKANSWE